MKQMNIAKQEKDLSEDYEAFYYRLGVAIFGEKEKLEKSERAGIRKGDSERSFK